MKIIKTVVNFFGDHTSHYNAKAVKVTEAQNKIL